MAKIIKVENEMCYEGDVATVTYESGCKKIYYDGVRDYYEYFPKTVQKFIETHKGTKINTLETVYE